MTILSAISIAKMCHGNEEMVKNNHFPQKGLSKVRTFTIHRVVD